MEIKRIPIRTSPKLGSKRIFDAITTEGGDIWFEVKEKGQKKIVSLKQVMAQIKESENQN